MKKIIILLIGILGAISIYILLNINTEKIYRFDTDFKIVKNGTIEYKSMTTEFLSKLEKMELENKVVSSNKYSVLIELNKKELEQIIHENGNKKYFTFYKENIYKLGDSIENQ